MADVLIATSLSRHAAIARVGFDGLAASLKAVGKALNFTLSAIGHPSG